MEKINLINSNNYSFNLTTINKNVSENKNVKDQKLQPADDSSSQDVKAQRSFSTYSEKPKVDLSNSNEKTKEQDLNPQEKIKLEKLKRADAHVKAHELAHIMAGGPYVRGGAHYTYIVGPDGNKYAIAGEVKIDMTPVPNNPDATIRKAETIRRAALAPSDPSPQDRAVAQKAAQMAMKARIEKLKEDSEKLMDIENKKNVMAPDETEKNNKNKNFNNENIEITTLKQLIKQYTNIESNKPSLGVHITI